jgi:Pectate lyase superfamily protein
MPKQDAPTNHSRTNEIAAASGDTSPADRTDLRFVRGAVGNHRSKVVPELFRWRERAATLAGLIILLCSQSATADVSGFFAVQGGIYYANGSGACQVTYDYALLSTIQLSNPHLSYFPSLQELQLTNGGSCTQTAVVPAGSFFTMDGTIYYSNGSGQACSYSNVPANINTSVLKAYPSFPTDLNMTYTGVCAGWGGPNLYPTSPLPASNSYFVTEGGIYFSNGAGHACQATYDSLILQGANTNAFGFPYFPSLAQAGLVNDGLCARPNISVGGFLVSDGSVYYVGADNNVCEFPFAGGIDTSAMAVYPAFPSDLFTNNGQCSTSPYRDIMTFGAAGDGVTDDSAAIQQAIAWAQTSGESIYFPPRTFLISQSDVSLSGSVTFRGLTSPAQINSGQSPATIVTPPTILVQGTVNAPTAVNSQILRGTSSIPIVNTFQAGQLLILNNFPTDKNGSDYCTVQSNQTCTYSTPWTSANQRQFRRRELIQVSSASASAITLAAPVLFDYETLDTLGSGNSFYTAPAIQGYAFLSLINPVKSVKISGITLVGMGIKGNFAENLTLIVPSAEFSSISGSSCYNCSVGLGDFDAQQTYSYVHFTGNSTNIVIANTTLNGPALIQNGIPTTAEQGMVELDQVVNAMVNITLGHYCPFSPTPTCPSPGTSQVLHGIQIDTNYEETPTGFTDIPDIGVNATVALGSSQVPNPYHDVQITADAFSAPVFNPTLSISGGATVCIKGATDVVDPYSLQGSPQTLQYTSGNGVGTYGSITANTSGVIALQIDVSSFLKVNGNYQSVEEAPAGTDPRNSNEKFSVANIVYGNTVQTWTGGC